MTNVLDSARAELARLSAERKRLTERIAEISRRSVELRESIKAEKERGVMDAIAKMPYRPRRIDMAILAVEGASLTTIAAISDLSPARIAQIVGKELRKSRHPSRWKHTEPHPGISLRDARGDSRLIEVLRQMRDE